MKRLHTRGILSFSLCLIIITACWGAPASAAAGIPIYMGGVPLTSNGRSVRAQELGGQIVLPAGEVFASLGGTCRLIPSTRRVESTYAGRTVEFQLWQDSMKLNGTVYNLTVGPKILDGTIWVPLDAVRQGYGISAVYEQSPERVVLGLSHVKSADAAYQYELIGHPFSNSYHVYFRFRDGLLSSKIIQFANLPDMKQKFTWIDETGQKHSNTREELYQLFSSPDNWYSSDWLSATFGSVYDDYLYNHDEDYLRQLVKRYAGAVFENGLITRAKGAGR